MQDNDRMRIVFYTLAIELVLLFQFAFLERLTRPDPKNYTSLAEHQRNVEQNPVFVMAITM